MLKVSLQSFTNLHSELQMVHYVVIRKLHCIESSRLYYFAHFFFFLFPPEDGLFPFLVDVEEADTSSSSSPKSRASSISTSPPSWAWRRSRSSDEEGVVAVVDSCPSDMAPGTKGWVGGWMGPLSSLHSTNILLAPCVSMCVPTSPRPLCTVLAGEKGPRSQGLEDGRGEKKIPVSNITPVSCVGVG